MSKIRFLKTRFGFEAGSVVDRNLLREGVVKTLFDFKVIEEVNDGSILVDQENVEPEQPARKPRRSKKSSKAKS